MTLTRRLLADYRRAFMWWSLGMVIMVGSTVGLWPSIRGQDQLEELMRDLPAALRGLFGGGEGISFISPPGYLQSRLFSLLLPVLLLVFGIGVGARAVGGAEESGNLELLLAHPVSRARLVAERYLATVGLLVALNVVALVSLAVLAPAVDLLEGISRGRLLGAGAAVLAVALLHASLAFAAGCASGRRGTAIAVAGAVAVGGYVLQGLIAATETLEPARFVSPWHWYLERNLLVSAPGFQAVLLPLLVSAAVTLAGAWAFVRRDLRLP